MRDDIKTSFMMTGYYLLMAVMLELFLEGDQSLSASFLFIVIFYLPILIIVVGTAFVIGRMDRFRKLYFFWPYYFIIFMLPLLGGVDEIDADKMKLIFLAIFFHSVLPSLIAAKLTMHFLESRIGEPNK